MSKKCLKCGLDCSDEDKFCIRCGAKFEDEKESKKICPYCGTECAESDLFCVHCGKPLKQGESENSAAPSDRAQVTTDDAQKTQWQYQGGRNADYIGGAQVYSYENERQERRKRTNKTLFALAFLSLILDLVYGLGCIMALVVFFIALNSFRQKKSSAALWAIVVSTASFIIGAAFLTCFIMVI